MSRAPIVIAHRGASGHRPEHGADAYRLAVELGADAIEPDIVATLDGVLVLRHENEISGTTDVADHTEFADRRTTKEVDGAAVTGWFTEDFTWAELSTLRIRERLPKLRPASAAHDGEGRIQRLGDLLDLLDADDVRSARGGAGVGLVAEIKHATYFESIGLPLDELVAAELTASGWATDPRLTVESFERTVLGKLRARGVTGRSVYLLESSGAAADLVARSGSAAPQYLEQLEPAALAELASGADGARIDGISLDKKMLIDAAGVADPALVARGHALGLDVFTWTVRPENSFVSKALRSSSHKADFGHWQTELARLVGTGVDGVFADYPELVRVALAEEPAAL
ncbi:glycerophosphoryl diester phosphodiesterase [Frondihabitans sucicola]|uniref:glycerophosphodiester phosphodiesterase n=1 Tax=Frondihabitans sucicola TaxID=1268041 RepID=A0ABN6XVT6_9MICO|nr:glycerophosphodiester phosphodiesterase family protein [Frondihabitans sucicola]BDZ49147.1 glycerophosphoryl diester phosphodiesterase [Frondihabitans sucicola]